MLSKSRLSIIIELVTAMTNPPKVHPGEVLLDEMNEREISAGSLATHIGVSVGVVRSICRGDRGIDAEMALRLSQSLGASPQFWLNLQVNWELSRLDAKRFRKIRPIAA